MKKILTLIFCLPSIAMAESFFTGAFPKCELESSDLDIVKINQNNLNIEIFYSTDVTDSSSSALERDVMITYWFDDQIKFLIRLEATRNEGVYEGKFVDSSSKFRFNTISAELKSLDNKFTYTGECLLPSDDY